jgi:hypothetical protein
MKLSKRAFLAVFSLVLFSVTVASAEVSKETAECMECHADLMPGLVDQWQDSYHWQAGVGCYECHGGKKG